MPWHPILARQLWDEGVTTPEIGKRLKMTKNAVVGKIHRAKFPPRPSPIRRRRAPKPKPLVAAASEKAVREIVPKPVVVPRDPVRTAARRKCLYTTGERRGYVLCDQPSEADSVWCAEHRESCTSKIAA